MGSAQEGEGGRFSFLPSEVHWLDDCFRRKITPFESGSGLDSGQSFCYIRDGKRDQKSNCMVSYLLFIIMHTCAD